MQQLLAGEGLGQEVVGPRFTRQLAGLGRVVAAADDDARRRVEGFEFFAEARPAVLRKNQIDQRHVEMLARGEMQRFLAAAGLRYVVTLVAQVDGHQPAEMNVVVHDQDFERHVRIL